MKIFLHTFGCKANQYDTELLRARLERGGGRSVETWKEADLCVVNSCSVTAHADRECRQFVRRLARETDHARIVVTGCYATHAPEELRALSPRVEVYSNAEKNSLPSCLGFEAAPEVFGLSRFSTRARAFVKIQDGCRAPCNYCIIPTTRPDLWNKPPDHVVAEIRSLVAEGHGEIVLTGIRLGLYRARGADGEMRDLTGLLRELVDLPGHFRLRLSSIEVTEVTDGIVRLAAATAKICPHFHIPLQSAEDGVLKAMGRWYVFQDYEERIRFIQSLLPHSGLTADVMVGFPTESEEAFRVTARRAAELGLTGLHVFPFSTRPGTRAAALAPLGPEIMRDRVHRLLAVGEDLKKDFRRRYAGTERTALAEPSGLGWTDNYLRVRVPSCSSPGTLVPVFVEPIAPTEGTGYN
jgi:threonylcarbamoyladenosine tRNA methylthiotransferase MtaB